MSAPTNYGDSRFDSAMSLPLPSSSQLSSTNTSAQHIAATPDDPHSGPWSRFNTRLGYDQAPACRHTEGPTALPDDIDDHASHAPRGYHPHGLEESIASIESRLCLPTYDSSTATTYSSPPSPPLPRPWAAASSATAPSTVSTSKYFESPNICCGQCGVEFTGVYRRGNLKRHVRQKHTGTKGGPYTCEADGCYRVFARQDARLKHARKHHPGLHPEPVQRRQGHERELTTSQTAQDGAVPSYHSRSNPVLIQSRPNPEAQSSMSPLVAFHTALPSSLDVSSAQWHSVPPQPLTSANRGPSTSYTHGSSTVASSLVFDVGQWLPTPPQISLREGNLGHDARQKLQQEVTSIEVEELPRAARVVFASLHAILDLDTYSRLCDITFARWERLLEQLRNEHSDAYPVYAKVVEDLYAVIHAIDSGAIDTASEASTAYSASRCRPSHGHQSASRGHEHGISTSGLGARAGLPANNGSKPIGRRASQPNGPGNNAKIIKGTKSKKSEFREVDCPEHKHYMMHRTPQSPTFPPCQGCRETVMAQVRSHLNRVIGHRDFDFVKQCSRCKTDFLDRATFANHDAANTCKHQAQSRRDIRVPWARLYLARYPEATRVPSPYCDDSGWLPDSVVAQCRLTRASSFLDQQQHHRNDFRGRTNPVGVASHSPIYQAALIHVLQDVVAPPPLRSNDTRAAALSRRISGLSSTGSQAPAQGMERDNQEQYLRTLQGASTQYLRALVDAPQNLTHEQLRATAQEAATVVNIISNYLQNQVQQIHNAAPLNPILAVPQFPTQDIDALYTTPMRNQASPTASNDQYGLTGMSTQPSSQGFDTSSSQYLTSTQTGHSSVSDPANQMLLSPFTPSNVYRRMSSSSQAATDALRRYGAFSPSPSLRDGFAYRDNQFNAMSPTIDPALLRTPQSDNEEDYDYDPRYLRLNGF